MVDPSATPPLTRLDLTGRAGFLHRGSWHLEVVDERSVDLRPVALAEATARRELRTWLADAPTETRDDAVLLTCELVTNAVRHAPDDDPERVVSLQFARANGVVRVEVCDGGPVFEPRSRTPGADGGFGLLLIDRLAARWGAAPDAPSCLWFELDVPAA